MAETTITHLTAERRCPNCGTRVARDAENCFMCGYDLRIKPRRQRRISWVDTLLVLAVLAVLGTWWGLGSRAPNSGNDAPDTSSAVLIADEPAVNAGAALSATELLTDSAAVPATITHTVREGETLVAIASVYGVTVDEIRSANPELTGDLIRPNQTLAIPIEPASRSAVVGTAPLIYTVRSGDTVVSIARAFGSTVQEMIDANRLPASGLIRPDQTLTVPVRNLPDEVLRTATLTETPTDGESTSSTRQIYLGPRLLGPEDEAQIARDENVLMRWLSVNELRNNEWYVLQIYPLTTDAEPVDSRWTKATSERLEAERLAPTAGAEARYQWQVSVVRVLPGEGSALRLESASPQSELRSFTWQ